MKISILIPVYNSADRLSQCIESVLRQTYQEIEIIVLDDGSNDGSDIIAKRYAAKDKRIKYYSQKNSGICKTRNRLAELMTGDYALFLDSDDRLEETACENLLKVACDYRSELVVFDYIREYGDGHISAASRSGSIKKISNAEATKAFVYNDYRFSMHLWRRFYSKRIIKAVKFGNNLLPEDYYTAFTYYRLARRIVYVDYPYYYYYISNSGLTCRNDLKYEKQRLEVIKAVYDEERDYSSDVRFVKRISSNYCNRIIVIYSKIICNFNSTESKLMAQKCLKELKTINIKTLEAKTKIAYICIRLFPKTFARLITMKSNRKQQER